MLKELMSHEISLVVQYIYICIFYFKAVMKSKMKDQILPKYLNRLTKFLNDHGERYFVGSKVKLFITYLVINNGFFHLLHG